MSWKVFSSGWRNIRELLLLKTSILWGVKLTHVHSIQETHRLSFVLRGFSHTHFHGGFRSQLKLFQGGSLPDPDDERGLHPARGTWGRSRPGDNLVLHFTAFSGIRNTKSGFYKWKFCSLAVSWVNRAGRKTDNHSHSTKSNHSLPTQRSRCTTHIWAWRESEAWTTFAQQRIVYRAIFQHSLQTNREMSTQQCSNTRKIRFKCILNQLESTAAHPLHGRLQTRPRHNPAGELTKTKKKKKNLFCCCPIVMAKPES